jgi:primosomal protein N'
MQHGGLSTRAALEGMAPPREIAQVVVELPLETPLDYRIPPHLCSRCRIGQRVLVPLGKRQILGYIVGLASTSAVADLKDLVEILDETPLLTPALLQLTHWIAEYYLCSWGQVLKAAVPEGFRVQTEAVYTLTAKAHAGTARVGASARGSRPGPLVTAFGAAWPGVPTTTTSRPKDPAASGDGGTLMPVVS